MTKAEALKILLESGIHYKRAIRTVSLFNDSDRVAEESKARMEYLYPTTENASVPNEETVVDDNKKAEPL